MPVVPDEAAAYGYVNENRHFVDVFLGRVAPLLTWDDGLEVMQILMTAYMSAQTEKTVAFPHARATSTAFSAMWRAVM